MDKAKYLGIISKNIVSADENATVKDIALLIKEHGIGAVVIMNGKKLVGIISERDLVTRVIASNLPPDTTLAKDIMTKDVVTVDFKEGLNKIYQTLCEITFRHLVITDGETLVGITSRRDLLDALACKKK
jgi:CBS domain-containing protein